MISQTWSMSVGNIFTVKIISNTDFDENEEHFSHKG